MKLCRFAALLAVAAIVFSTVVRAQAPEKEIVKPKGYAPPVLTTSEELKRLIDGAVSDVLKKFSEQGLKSEEIAVTVIDMRDRDRLLWAEHRGETAIYPASVVKMFYMAALHQQIEDGKIAMTRELERGLRDMIVTSSNEATQYIVDVLTDTASGGELPQKEFEQWSFRRNRMNRYFASMDFVNINVNQKTHCEDAYGVEQQFRNYKGENRLMITTNASARLIAEIALGRMVNPERSRLMMNLLKREPFAEGKAANSQATDFVGKALIDLGMREAGLWSKAGWTSRTRHDAAYIEMPDGGKFAIAIFTENRSNERDLIPTLASSIITALANVSK
ncbi:MAG TPA: serine hydrolase [Pyrinomonadaceae bacterium]|nr:serine hydrolase [Pyrinomonadaceae bacterium]HMP66686.1 serine hydrolase [Pyrinomonadaceae bacterium]